MGKGWPSWWASRRNFLKKNKRAGEKVGPDEHEAGGWDLRFAPKSERVGN